MLDKSQGFVPIWRTILNWEWYSDINTTRLFLHLLIKANYEPKKWQGIVILPGQFITSQKHLSKETGLGVQSVRTSLDKLKSTREVTVFTTSKYSLIQLNNWEKFNTVTREVTRDQRASNAQVTSTKNVNNENKQTTEPSEVLKPVLEFTFKESEAEGIVDMYGKLRARLESGFNMFDFAQWICCHFNMYAFIEKETPYSESFSIIKRDWEKNGKRWIQVARDYREKVDIVQFIEISQAIGARIRQKENINNPIALYGGYCKNYAH